jgi:hypothetical protein
VDEVFWANGGSILSKLLGGYVATPPRWLVAPGDVGAHQVDIDVAWVQRAEDWPTATSQPLSERRAFVRGRGMRSMPFWSAYLCLISPAQGAGLLIAQEKKRLFLDQSNRHIIFANVSVFFIRVGTVFVVVADAERAAEFVGQWRPAEQAGIFEPGEFGEIA